jgi:hypothetical protein
MILQRLSRHVFGVGVTLGFTTAVGSVALTKPVLRSSCLGVVMENPGWFPVELQQITYTSNDVHADESFGFDEAMHLPTQLFPNCILPVCRFDVENVRRGVTVDVNVKWCYLFPLFGIHSPAMSSSSLKVLLRTADHPSF